MEAKQMLISTRVSISRPIGNCTEHHSLLEIEGMGDHGNKKKGTPDNEGKKEQRSDHQSVTPNAI